MRMWAFTSTSRRAVATASPDTSARTAEAKTLRLAVLMYLVVFTVKLITYLATGVRVLFAEALLIAPQWGSINRRFVGRLMRGQLCDATVTRTCVDQSRRPLDRKGWKSCDEGQNDGVRARRRCPVRTHGPADHDL